MGAIISAVIAGLVAVLGIYLTQFLAERYRRFHDGSALAAGLLGELKAYEPGYHILQKSLDAWIRFAEEGHSDAIKMRGLGDAGDLFFKEAVPKLGLLGADMVSDVIFVYQNIRAGRAGLEVLDKQFTDMTPQEFIARCLVVKATYAMAWDRGQVLVPKLEGRAGASFKVLALK